MNPLRLSVSAMACRNTFPQDIGRAALNSMLFHTWIFLAFFLVVYPGYLLLKGTRLKLPWLLAASYVFYGWWNPAYLLLIAWTTSVDYLAVLAMAKTPWKKPWLAAERRQ